MKSETTFIYALADPETGETRYVGKADDPAKRVREHVREARRGVKTHRNHWLRSLLNANRRPGLSILIEVPSVEWEMWERAVIKAFRILGVSLTNATDGGDAPPITRGRKHTLETRAKMSRTRLGRKHSPEHCVANRNSKLGKKFTPERCKNISLALIGRTLSPEHIRNRTLAVLGAKRVRKK